MKIRKTIKKASPSLRNKKMATESIQAKKNQNTKGTSKDADQVINGKKKLKVILPKRDRELFVTQSQFQEFRGEMNSKFTSVNLELTSIRMDFNARFDQVNARFEQMSSQFSSLHALIHQIKIIVEEQNNRNRFVLDGFANLYASLDAYKSENNEKIKNLESLFKISSEAQK